MSPGDQTQAADQAFMDEALELASESVGSTAPNPAVGAVIVRDGVVLGRGRTQPVGGPHAEAEALRMAAANGHTDVRGATMYVTLEPCCHWGRTAPCTDAITAAGLARVVVGVVDPYEPMQGKGLATLREAGIEVELGVRAERASALVRGFTRAVTQGLPDVTCKVACSLDGRIATASGESKWITGPEARADGHRLRARHDGIVVGIGTVLADDPTLTCRGVPGSDPAPIVLDTDLRLPDSARLLRGTVRPIVICADDIDVRALNADVIRVPRVDSGVDLEAALRALAGRGIHRLLIEGGGQVHRSMLDTGLVDTLHVYLAGTVIPGGRPWMAGPALQNLADAPRWGAPVQVKQLGVDVRLTYRPHHRFDDP